MNVTSILALPVNDRSWDVKFEDGDKASIKFDLEKGKVEVSAPDATGFWQQLQAAGGLEVGDGQFVEWKPANDKLELQVHDGVIKLKGPLPTLVVTATDEAQNSVVVTATP
ncbi:MAG: hypothetical protein D6775_09145 [Caldilineae bacterium]|nr:MAG: hypothetical protein D6775_09145 [Caldilineae bacterium]